MSTIDEVKSRIDIVDLVSEAGVKLRKAGRNYTGFCPFHDNKRTPAFVVWPESGTWRCFGQCNEGGDIFKFVMKKQGWDFKEALQRLAERAGVELQQYTPQQEAQKEVYDTLRALLEEALLYYRNHLLNNPDVLNYLHEKRGLTDASIETFGLGYAPPGWDNALKHFTERGYSEQNLFEAGLLSERESGGHYDRFRNRIMIPIRDERGRMTGFGARIVDPDDVPKFLNSPETPLFSKGRLLYGLDRARKAIRAADQVVIVEGYLDVIVPHQAGFENVVSPMGTALTEDQLRLLKRFTRKIVLALDPDAAGQKAILRGLDAARHSLDREKEIDFDAGASGMGGFVAEPIFDAPSMLRHASRLNAEIRVASLPENQDPDEVVLEHPDNWVEVINSSLPIVIHVMDRLTSERDINNTKVKADIVAEVLPLIEDLPDPTERDTYRQWLARRLKVDERTFVNPSTVYRVRGRKPRRSEKGWIKDVSNIFSAGSPTFKFEAYCISVLYRKPELLNRLDRRLQEAGLQRLINEDFGYTDHQMLLDLIRQSLEQDRVDHHQFVVEHLPEDLEEQAGELLKQTEKLDPLEERLLEELQRSIIKLRRMGLNESLNQLRFMLEEAQQQGDLRATAYQEQVLQHTRLLRDLDYAGRKLSLRRIE